MMYLEEEYNKGIEKAYQQGRIDERKKIMEIVDGADDIYQAMYLLKQYIISIELN